MSERLTERECSALGTLAASIDCSRIRVHRSDAIGIRRLLRSAVLLVSRGRAVALGNHIFLPDRHAQDLAVLAHEVTHAGQYQRWGALSYFSRGAVAQLRDLLYRTTRIGRCPYHYTAVRGSPFRRMEWSSRGRSWRIPSGVIRSRRRSHPFIQAA